MAMIVIYLLLYLYIIYYDLVPVKRNKYNGVFVFNLITMSIAFVLVVLVGFDVMVPNPSDFIERIVKFIIG
ncbi:MAG: hypothetical protein ACOCG5_06670 [Candidatus Alkaliphilus sp. MAG34]|nr:hypothetical protein [Clostridiales bacterium]